MARVSNYVVRFLSVFTLSMCLCAAQAPRVGEINYYGLRKLTPEKIQSVLGLRPGETLPPSRGDLEERLTELPGVIDARVEAVCCEGAATALFIGVEERGSAHFDTREAPSGSAVLPDEVLDHYREYLAASARSQSAEARRLEQGLTDFAAGNLELLRDVLRNSSEPDHRTAAAAIIAYVPKKAAVVNDLQFALRDAEESVRAAAARSLRGIAVAARKDPELGIKVAPVWFVEMLNSVVLGDRLEAAQALVVLTDQPNQTALDVMRDRALVSLAEMARWKTLDYALPAFLLIGRTAAIPEADLHAQWQKGDRESAIRKAMAKGK